MYFQRIKTPGIAHNAYLIGSEGMAAIIDPRRDVEEYLTLARANGMRLRYVIETHRQEDFVLGSAELRRTTGAQIVAGEHPLFGSVDLRLQDGAEMELGELKIRALATPGHTPESLSYALYAGAHRNHAWGVFSGDALFIGESGRTDLAAADRTADNAALLHDSVHGKLLPLGDQTLLFPAHGAGSVCGGHIANRDESSIGLERVSNPIFTLSRDAFVRHKLSERLPRPPYFSRMESLNFRGGSPVACTAAGVPVLPVADFARAIAGGIIIDARLPEAFAGGHLPQAYSVWLAGLPIFGGWVADESMPVYLVLETMGQVELAIASLQRIGVDHIGGVLGGGFEAWRNMGQPIEISGTMTPARLQRVRADYLLLDVREIGEFEAGHIEGATHIYVGELESALAAGKSGLQPSERIVVTCSVGHRASLGVSVLHRHGFKHVWNLLGGMTAWQALGFPVQSEHAPR